MRLGKIIRHPIKGFTPQSIESGMLTAGLGLAYDRYCGFTCGNLPDQPIKGGWVQARTFLQLTVFPKVAEFKAEFDESGPSIVVTAPDGRSAKADLEEPEGFAEANELIRSCFEPGPHAVPELHVQAPGHGHWDFTDTGLSIINLASVRELSKAAVTDVDPTRFRGNLLLDDLPAWSEFSMVGRRYRIGEAEIELTRPARRCAATTVDPATAATDLNVPVILRKLTGHLYCGVYARVVKTGKINVNDKLEDLGVWEGNPNEDLPWRTPEPDEWPRFIRLAEYEDGNLVLQNLSENWPLPSGNAGDEIRLHPVAGDLDEMLRLKLARSCGSDKFVCEATDGLVEGARFLASGPYSV